MIGITRTILTRIKHVNLFIQRNAQNNAVTLDENTLTGRFIAHLSKPYKNTQHESQLNPRLIQNRQCKTIDTAAIYKTRELNVDTRWEEVQRLDAEYWLHVRDVNVNTMLDVLNAYTAVIPEKITKLLFYKSSMKYLSNRTEFLTVAEKIRFMFYVSLQKRNRNAQTAINKCLQTFTNMQIERLSVEDLCVVCSSAFKTSTKIRNVRILNRVLDTINGDLALLKDVGFLITLVKTLRHNRYQNEDVLSTIACAIFFNSTYEHYGFTAMCHILALYADYLYYEENILKLFTEKCVGILGENADGDKIRAKDIKRLLWSCSNLGFKLKKDDVKDVVIPRLIERIELGEFADDPESLVECVMYLWMLNYQATELVPYTLNAETIRKIKENKSNTTQRLNLLLTCVQLENRTLYKTLGIKPDKFFHFDMPLQISTRPYLQRVYYALRQVQKETTIDKFSYECEIPNMKIVGITGFTKIYKKVFIEVLDEHFCVKNRKACAAGLMQLKLRLLDDMDQALIIVPNNEIDEMSDKELEDHLKSELKLVL